MAGWVRFTEAIRVNAPGAIRVGLGANAHVWLERACLAAPSCQVSFHDAFTVKAWRYFHGCWVWLRSVAGIGMRIRMLHSEGLAPLKYHGLTVSVLRALCLLFSFLVF